MTNPLLRGLVDLLRPSVHGLASSLRLVVPRSCQRTSRPCNDLQCRDSGLVQRTLWNVRPRPTLLRLDVGRADHLAPLLSFVGNELAKVGWRVCEHVATQIRKPRLPLGIGLGRVDLRLVSVDGPGGRSLRCAYAEPDTRLVAGQDLADRRNIWQFLQACETGDRKC